MCRCAKCRDICKRNINSRGSQIFCKYRASRIMRHDWPDVTSHSTALSTTRSYVESHSTTLSVVSDLMSSHTRQLFLLFQVQCRVILDSAFHYQVLCRVTLDHAFRRFRSNVESHSTAVSNFSGRMSSHTRHRFLLYQV